SEIARIHAEEELKLMIEGLYRSNDVIAKHLSEYEQVKADLSVGEKIELITSPLRYALTVKPTIFVSHIRQFWSTARIETTDEGTHILATVDGIQRTVSESSLRRNLKLRDEDGLVSLPDTELFENLTLMGYNISQSQKLTFQKG
nr:hypothetical protein [Tanacetum cinerariifolium]